MELGLWVWGTNISLGDFREMGSSQVKKFNLLKSRNNSHPHRLNAYPLSCIPGSVDTINSEKLRLFKSISLPQWTKLLKIKANPIYKHAGEPCLISIYWIISNYKYHRDMAIPIIEIRIYANIFNVITTYILHILD